MGGSFLRLTKYIVLGLLLAAAPGWAASKATVKPTSVQVPELLLDGGRKLKHLIYIVYVKYAYILPDSIFLLFGNPLVLVLPFARSDKYESRRTRITA